MNYEMGYLIKADQPKSARKEERRNMDSPGEHAIGEEMRKTKSSS